MTSVNDMFNINRELLLNAIEVCHSIPAEINKFGATVSSLPALMVKARLITIQGLVSSNVKALRVQHEGKGYIFVQAGNSTLSICWSKLDFLDGKEEAPSSGESVFIAPEVVVKKIEELISQVDSGELVSAINWLSRYENVRVDS